MFVMNGPLRPLSIIRLAKSVSHVVPELKAHLVAINILALFSCSIQLATPFLFGKSLTAMFSPQLADGFNRDLLTLIGCGVLSALLSAIEGRLVLRLRHRSIMLLEIACCGALLDKDVPDVNSREAGELASCINLDVSAAADLLGLQSAACRIVFLTFGSLVAIFSINIRLGCAVLGIALVYCFLIRSVTPAISAAYRIASAETAKTSSYLYQLIGSVLDIRTFGSRDFFIGVFGNKARSKSDAMVTAGWLSKKIDQGSYTVHMIGSFIVLIVAARHSEASGLSLSRAIAAIGVLAFFWSSLRSSMAQLLNVKRNAALIERLCLWLHAPTKRSKGLEVGTGTPRTRRPSLPCSKAISFRDVSYTFPGSNEDVLSDLSFDIERGERILISGSNGAGKTTLMLLMLGIMQPTSGSISVCGKPLRDIDVGLRHRLIVRAAHDGCLFPVSVENNVLFGRDSWLRNESIAKSMELSGCDALIGDFARSEGVGARGGQLSAGQRQRVLLARALAEDSEILLLDEATSSIDYESVVTIYRELLLSQESRLKTIVVTAHHSDFLRSLVDRKFHLSGGRLYEMEGKTTHPPGSIHLKNR